MSPRKARSCRPQWEHDHGRLLPRRGTVHDIGRTLTHKPLIIRKLFLEGKGLEQASRETRHSPEAVHRYIEAFKRVLLLRRNGLSIPDIAYAVHMPPLLVAEYSRLIDQLGEENTVLKHLLHTDGKGL